MKTIKNKNGKTVCRADAKQKVVEIVHKGYTTIIRFLPDNTYEIVNLPQAN